MTGVPSDLARQRHQGWLLPLTDNLALLAGLMATTGLPPFRGTGPLVPVALALLLRVLLTAPLPARSAWLFGLAHQTSLLYWLFFLEPSASIPTRWLVPVQAILAILYVSIFYFLFGVVFRLVRDRLGPTTALLTAPVLWTGMEALRAAGELGFPWCLAGAAWVHTPLLRLAAASGEIGLSAGTAFVAVALVAVFQRGGRHRVLAPGGGWRLALIGAVVLLWGGLAVGTALPSKYDPPPVTDSTDLAAGPREPVKVAAIQANVALADKWQPARIDSTIVPYTYLTEQAARAGAELVVWAETAIPAYVRYNEPELLAWVRKLAAQNRLFLFTGFPDAELTPDGTLLKFNSSGLFDPQGFLIDRYAKHHLLPVGERMPFSRFLPFLARIDMGQAEWEPGEPPGPVVVPAAAGEFSFAGLICFESIFSGLARQAVRAGAQVLVNITNDGWFGQTAGPRQHAALARLRAAECGVPLVRCANNGVSFVVAATGEVVKMADLGQRAVVLAEVQPGPGDTLFVRAGGRPLALFLVLWSVLALVLIRSEKQ